MEEINSLEDMLVEVKKIMPIAEVFRDVESKCCWLIGREYFEHGLFIQLTDNGYDFGTTALENDWDVYYLVEACDNPQDILAILRAIHNCGKPEEEKIK